MKSIIFAIVLLTVGCVSSAPHLSPDQEMIVKNISIHKAETPPDREYIVIEEIKAADCTGPHKSRLYGQDELSIETLKRKAAALGAEAVIDVSCRHVPYVNNCWAASLCTGKAVKWK